MPVDLKQPMSEGLTELYELASALRVEAQNMQTISSQEAGGMVKRFNDCLVHVVKRCQDFAGVNK